MRSGKTYGVLALGLVLLAVGVGWFGLRDRDEAVLEKVSGEVVDGRAAELVSVEYLGGGGSLRVRLRIRPENFDVDELMVCVSPFVLSPTGFDQVDIGADIEWLKWDDPETRKEQLLLLLKPKSPFDRVEIELHYEGELTERATYDWPQC